MYGTFKYTTGLIALHSRSDRECSEINPDRS